MTLIPRNVYDMPAVTLKELRGYVAEVWSGQDWEVWITEQGFGLFKTVSLHIGGRDAQGARQPAESYHGHNRQQAMLRARICLVALLRCRVLTAYGHDLTGINELRERMGLARLEVSDRGLKSRKNTRSRKGGKA